MSQPYSTQDDVTNQTLLTLATQAEWNLNEGDPSDIEIRIQEADSEIDGRLGALGYALPFGNNPPLLKTLSVLYARYACFRDLFAAGSPSGGSDATKAFEDAFESRMEKLVEGKIMLVDAFGNVITNDKYNVIYTQNTAPLTEPGEIISTYIEEYDKKDMITSQTSIIPAIVAPLGAPGTYAAIVATNPSDYVFRFATDVNQLLFYTKNTALGVNGWTVE